MMTLTGLPIHLPVLPINLPVDTFSDGNFAAPAQTKAAPNDYSYNPTGSPWVFLGQAGASGNASSFTAGNPAVAAGTQVAFLQKTGTVSQTFELSQGTYSISFQAAQRQNVQSSFQAFEVWVDSTLVDLVVPATTGYTAYHSMNFTVTGTGVHIIEFKGVNPLAGDNTALLTKVQINGAAATADPNEPTVLGQAVSDFQRDGSVTYDDMLGLLGTAVAEVPPIITYHNGTGKGSVFSQGGLTTPEMQWLKTIVDDSACLKMPADVSNLASKVVNGDPGNATYLSLGKGGVAVSSPLGNLFAATTANNYLGSSATQFQELVNKWYLGGDYPLAGYAYAPTSGVLFGSGGPSYTDVYQGALGDCWLMASLEEAALKTPSLVEGMFHAEGNGVWTVRFYTGSKPTYVTVNDELPDGGGAYTHVAPGGILWAALAEKAYAELFGSNNYANLNQGGFSQGPLAEITGRSVWDTSFYHSIFGVIESNGTVTSENHLASQIYQAFESGQLVTLGSNGNGTNGQVCGNHMYALIGAQDNDGAYSFTLGNPWGPAGGRPDANGNWYPGTVSNLSEGDLFSNFDYVAFTQGTSPATATSGSAKPTGEIGSGAVASASQALLDAAISQLGRPAPGPAARRTGPTLRSHAAESPLGRPAILLTRGAAVVRRDPPGRIKIVQDQRSDVV